MEKAANLKTLSLITQYESFKKTVDLQKGNEELTAEIKELRRENKELSDKDDKNQIDIDDKKIQ